MLTRKSIRRNGYKRETGDFGGITLKNRASLKTDDQALYG